MQSIPLNPILSRGFDGERGALHERGPGADGRAGGGKRGFDLSCGGGGGRWTCFQKIPLLIGLGIDTVVLLPDLYVFEAAADSGWWGCR